MPDMAIIAIGIGYLGLWIYASVNWIWRSEWFLSFQVKTVGSGPTARVLIFKLYLIVFLYSGFLVYFFDFSIKTVGGGPTRQSLFVIR